MPPRRLLIAALGSTMTAAAIVSPTVASAGGAATTTNGCVASVPEPGSNVPVNICYSLFKPAGVDRGHKVPMVMHSHGWGGSRETSASSKKVQPFLDAGYGVLSFDQRGFGQSN